MRSLASYLLLFFMIMFWVFRIVVAFTSAFAIDIGFAPLDLNFEIVLLFVTLLSILFVAKRKLIGAILYLVSYGLYFGVDLYSIVMNILNGSTTLVDYTRALVSFIGVVLPTVLFLNMLVDRNRTNHPVDKKTDWFYKGDQYDRKLDDRLDKNQYRNY